MLGVKTQNKVIALVMTMAMAIACSLAIAPAAFADLSTATAQMDRTTVPWNSNVTVTAMGGNGTYTIDSTTHTATITENTTKTENGQYVHVVMQFISTADLTNITSDNARTYLQANATIAGRSLNGTDYNREIFNVVVDDVDNVISFDIAYNTAGTTANYNGKLNIAANSSSNSAFAYAMGGSAVETLIGTGVAITNNSGVLSNNNNTKTFTITSAAYNRGMVHVLIKDGNNAIFSGTGTFSNGGLTVHAHTFITQTVADFADTIATTATGLTNLGGYTFGYNSDGTFTVTNTSTGASNIKAFIYDCNYLNANSLAVGEITEAEYQN